MRIWGLLLFVLSTCVANATNDKYPILNIADATYTNVTIMDVTATDIYFQHTGGFGNVKLDELSPEMRKKYEKAAAKAGEIQKRTQEQSARFVNAQTKGTAKQTGGPKKITNANPTFSFTLPAGFERSDEGKQGMQREMQNRQTKAEAIDCYLAFDSIDLVRVLAIVDMKSPIHPDHAVGEVRAMEKKKEYKKVSVFEQTWKNERIQGMRGITETKGKEMVELDVFLPVKPSAVMLSLAGTKDQEPELLATLRSVLASFDGEVEWAPKYSRNAIGFRVGWLVGFSVSFLIVFMIVRAFRSNS